MTAQFHIEIIMHYFLRFSPKLWNQVTSSSLSRWKILTLEKNNIGCAMGCREVEIWLLINSQKSTIYKSQLHIAQPIYLNCQQRKATECQIHKWSEEVTWFLSFDFLHFQSFTVTLECSNMKNSTSYILHFGGIIPQVWVKSVTILHDSHFADHFCMICVLLAPKHEIAQLCSEPLKTQKGHP